MFVYVAEQRCAIPIYIIRTALISGKVVRSLVWFGDGLASDTGAVMVLRAECLGLGKGVASRQHYRS